MTRNPEKAKINLKELLVKFGIESWDLLLIGDGSGSGWARGCGWACVLIEHATFARHIVHGGMSHGTVNLAELLPYIHAMLWYIEGPWTKPAGRRTKHVYVITDSQVTAQQGNRHARRDGQPLWSMIDYIESKGYKFHFCYIRRASLELNTLVDYVSRASRIAAQKVTLPRPGSTVYEYDPE